MTTKKPSKPKPTPVIKFSEQRLAIGYAELLHLRRAVRQAELLAKMPKSGASELRSN
jgi:hypothetical protein